jgi:MinD superfamily P-loop ATPase
MAQTANGSSTRSGTAHPWLAVASGKGGTGKTSVAVSLAKAFLNLGRRVQLIDADVEAPNLHHFLELGTPQEFRVNSMLPVIDPDLCDENGGCVEICQFKALAAVGRIMVFPELCHGCEACLELCPRHAIRAGHQEIGIIKHWAGNKLDVWQGHLHIGKTLTPSVIRNMFNRAREWQGDITIVDAPPGTSCPMVAAVRLADHLLLVTEPTAFGKHDLELAVEVGKQLHLPSEVVINRTIGQDDEIDSFCRARGIGILERFPEDRLVAEAYAHGQAMGTLGGHWSEGFERLARHLEQRR